jgi:choline dehydrogenase-like flavoprotein
VLVNTQDLPRDGEIIADICIVGSGPAGIAIAMEFDGLPLRVAILEAGNLQKETAISSRERLAPDSSFGDFFFDMPGRQVGGNSNLWGIQAPGTQHGLRLIPLRPVDFEQRQWMPESGWPVSPDYFDEYYSRARAFLGGPSRGYTAEDWATADCQPLPLNRDRLCTGVFQFADGEIISKHYRDAIIASENITLYTNASVAEVCTDPSGGSITMLKIAVAPDHHVTARANQFVLAAGALWTTQLLLASGLGNSGGHLGRHLSTHPLVLGGRFKPFSSTLYGKMKLYDLREVDGMGVMGHLQLADKAVRSENLIGSSFLLFAVERGATPSLSSRQKRGLDALTSIKKALETGSRISTMDLVNLFVGFDGAVRSLIARVLHNKFHFDVGGWSKLPDQSTRFEGFDVLQIAEQSPSADNFVYLCDERDRLGMRKLGIRWKYTAENAAAIRKVQNVLKEELANAGIGDFEISSEPDGKPTTINAHANHYFGITRMSSRPEDGVVDTDCRVHGIANLYVASSSVFPTGGFANPTLTIIALAKRVADTMRLAWLQALPEAKKGFGFLAVDRARSIDVLEITAKPSIETR